MIHLLAAAEPVLAAAGLGLQVIIGDTRGSTDPSVLASYDTAPAVVEVVCGLEYQFSRSRIDAVCVSGPATSCSSCSTTM